MMLIKIFILLKLTPYIQKRFRASMNTIISHDQLSNLISKVFCYFTNILIKGYVDCTYAQNISTSRALR